MVHWQWQLGQVPEQVALVPQPEPLQLVVSVQSFGAAIAVEANSPPPANKPTIRRSTFRRGSGLASVRAKSSKTELIYSVPS